MQLDLTLEQVNLVLQSLAAQPYQAVAKLIQEVHEQAQAQQPMPANNTEPIAEETNHA